jgi:hypothetical protein
MTIAANFLRAWRHSLFMTPASQWRAIALENRIPDPLDLQAGAVLVIPTLTA